MTPAVAALPGGFGAPYDCHGTMDFGGLTGGCERAGFGAAVPPALGFDWVEIGVPSGMEPVYTQGWTGRCCAPTTVKRTPTFGQGS
jgi:hypothetical protein